MQRRHVQTREGGGPCAVAGGVNVKQIREKAHIPKPRPTWHGHEPKDTNAEIIRCLKRCATRQIPRSFSSRLGHSSISITMDRYRHLMDSFDTASADLIAAL